MKLLTKTEGLRELASEWLRLMAHDFREVRRTGYIRNGHIVGGPQFYNKRYVAPRMARVEVHEMFECVKHEKAMGLMIECAGLAITPAEFAERLLK